MHRSLRRTPVATYAIALSLGVLQRLVLGFLPCDDAFITYRFANQLAHHGELVYNLGERAFGCTALLYATLLGGAQLLGLSIETVSWWLTLAGDLAVCGLLVWLAGQLYQSRWLGLACVFLWLTHPVVGLNAIGGMETSIFTALMLLTGATAISRRFGIALICAGLLVWVRIDGLAVLPILYYAWRKAGRPPVKPSALVVAIALFAGYASFTTWYYGSPIPLSALAKAQGSRGSLMGSSLVALAYAASLGGILSVWYLILSPHVVLLAGFFQWLSGRTERLSGETILMLMAGAHAGMYVIAGRITAVLYPWYFVPFITLCLLPSLNATRKLFVTERSMLRNGSIVALAIVSATAALVCLLLCFCIQDVTSSSGSAAGEWMFLGILSFDQLVNLWSALIANAALLSLLAVGSSAVAIANSSRAASPRTARLLMSAVLTAGILLAITIDLKQLEQKYARRETAYLELGRWVQAHAPAGEWVGAREIGALGWALLNHPMYDEAGLVTRGALERSRATWTAQRRPALVVGVSRGSVGNALEQPPLLGYTRIATRHIPVWIRDDLRDRWYASPPALP